MFCCCSPPKIFLPEEEYPQELGSESSSSTPPPQEKNDEKARDADAGHPHSDLTETDSTTLLSATTPLSNNQSTTAMEVFVDVVTNNTTAATTAATLQDDPALPTPVSTIPPVSTLPQQQCQCDACQSNGTEIAGCTCGGFGECSPYCSACSTHHTTATPPPPLSIEELLPTPNLIKEHDSMSPQLVGVAHLNISEILHFLPPDEDETVHSIEDTPHFLRCQWVACLPDARAIYSNSGEQLVDDLGLYNFESLDDPETQLVHQPWVYRFNISSVTGTCEKESVLPFCCKSIHCTYSFNGQEYHTQPVTNTNAPVFNYSHIHRVENVDIDFIQDVQTRPFRLSIYVTKEDDASEEDNNNASTKEEVQPQKQEGEEGGDVETKEERQYGVCMCKDERNPSCQACLKKEYGQWMDDQHRAKLFASFQEPPPKKPEITKEMEEAITKALNTPPEGPSFFGTPEGLLWWEQYNEKREAESELEWQQYKQKHEEKHKIHFDKVKAMATSKAKAAANLAIHKAKSLSSQKMTAAVAGKKRRNKKKSK